MHPAAPALPESGHPYQLLSVVLSSRQVLYLHLLHQPTEIFYTLLQCSGMRCILLLYHCSRKGNHNNLNDLHHNSAVYLSLFLLHTDRLQPDRSAIYFTRNSSSYYWYMLHCSDPYIHPVLLHNHFHPICNPLLLLHRPEGCLHMHPCTAGS